MERPASVIRFIHSDFSLPFTLHLLPLCAQHIFTNFIFIRFTAHKLRHNLAFIHNYNSVRKSKYLIELSRYQ